MHFRLGLSLEMAQAKNETCGNMKMRNGPKHLAMILLSGLTVLFAYPFTWMIFAGFKGNDAIFKPWPLLPESFPLTAFIRLWSGELIPFPRLFANTLWIAAAQTLIALILCTTAGFVLARYSFRAKFMVFVLAVLVVLIPRQAMVLPLFIWMNHLHLLDTSWSVIFPGAVSGIGLLFFVQAWKRVPQDFFLLARAEGASPWQTFRMTLPLLRPSLFAYGLIHFIFAWQEHLIPLVMISTPQKMTLGISLATLNGASLHTPYSLLMAASTMAVIPAFIVFAILFRHLRTALADMTSA
jgi:multiple sugar transport system permease protein